MFENLLPQPIDNTYRGHKLALVLLALVVAVKMLQGVMVIFNGHSIAEAADGIPLDTYTPAAAQTILALFAFSGLSRVILSLLGVLALIRYRSAVSFILMLLALEYLARELIQHFVPIIRTGSPIGPAMNFILFVLTVVGLALALWKRRRLETKEN